MDENGTISSSVKDKVHEADRKQRPYEQKLKEYRDYLGDLPDLEWLENMTEKQQ